MRRFSTTSDGDPTLAVNQTTGTFFYGENATIGGNPAIGVARSTVAARCSSTNPPMPKRRRVPTGGVNLKRLKKVSAGGMLRVPRPEWTHLLPAADRCHHSAINMATQGRRRRLERNKVKAGET